MASCWARCLGNCGGGVSREHYISASIFDDEWITVEGFDWCRNKPVRISLASAASKMLCRRHNQALSDCDAEASKLSRFMSKNLRDDPLAEGSINLSGRLLERWALKTLFNFGRQLARRSNTTALDPPKELVEAAFGLVSLPDGAGLYLVSSSISHEGYEVGVACDAIRDPSNESVLGMSFNFSGLRLVVSILALRAEQKIRDIGVVHGFDYGAAEVTYQPRRIGFNSATAGKKGVYLEW